jgi:hypothetical protein
MVGPSLLIVFPDRSLLPERAGKRAHDVSGGTPLAWHVRDVSSAVA